MTKLQYAQLVEPAYTEQDIADASEKVVFADMQDDFEINWEWFVANRKLDEDVANEQKEDCVNKAMMETIRTGKLIGVEQFFNFDEYNSVMAEYDIESRAIEERNRYLVASLSA